MNMQIMRIFDNYQVMAVAFVVSEKEVLAMGCFDVFPVFTGFFDGCDRRMPVIVEENIEFLQ